MNESTLNPRPGPRRHVLLAMGYFNFERQTGIVRYARKAGWSVDFRLPLFHAIDQDKQYIQTTRYDGILSLLSLAAPWMAEFVQTMNIPVVDMWNDFPQLKYPRVLLDNYQIGKLGALHLMERGFENFLYYSHTIEGRTGQRRFQGFVETLRAAGKDAQALFWDHQSPENQSRGRLEFLRDNLFQAKLPVAVMASNDNIACEVLDAAEMLDLKVPRDIAVLGCNNDPHITELARVPLSSIETPLEQVGYESAQLLDHLIDGNASPAEPVLIAPRIVVTRQSTDILATQDRDVATAIQYIQDHFQEPISVDEIAEKCTISRRLLQDRFLKNTGRTIIEAINAKRLEHAQYLLLQPQIKLQQIARLSGFGSGERLSKVFRAAHDMTPSEFRSRNIRQT